MGSSSNPGELLRGQIRELVPSDGRSLVVHSGLHIAFLKNRDCRPLDLLAWLLDELGAVSPLLVVPAFPTKYEKTMDLTTLPSSTGVLADFMLQERGAARTVSAFFPYATLGDGSERLLSLRPTEAWGNDSLYAWMRDSDVRFLTVGVHPTHISFLHRYEWDVRDRLTYRKPKQFTTDVVHARGREMLSETLLVREPRTVLNDFTPLMPEIAGSVLVKDILGVQAASITCSELDRRIAPLFEENPDVSAQFQEATCPRR